MYPVVFGEAGDDDLRHPQAVSRRRLAGAGGSEKQEAVRFHPTPDPFPLPTHSTAAPAAGAAPSPLLGSPLPPYIGDDFYFIEPTYVDLSRPQQNIYIDRDTTAIKSGEGRPAVPAHFF
ncbi:MAG: hypothetical protein BJ554DRAFT_5980 [Olpidium bornovanus]|uniref:Uncharacterized protein n=1 Tax=Olpidium bornovanus TaxID=278681 RepID=A0A8H7ZYI5_9FUNG|nr:MAG: hypothetical protein BJ554DRAFT_5980 [Olpidium bornovanus]